MKKCFHQVALASSFSIFIFGLLTSQVAGAQSTFRITQVFSTVDGSLQYVELTESAGLNGQQHFAGLTLTSTHAGVVKQYTFRSDLPTDQTARMSIVVATSRVPVYTGTGYNCCYDAEFVVPARFFATDGGTIDFAGFDHLSYAPLPIDGLVALERSGATTAASVPRGARCLLGPGCATDRYYVGKTYPAAIEYRHVTGHYFITSSAPDIDALDSGRVSGWQRTGASFLIGAAAGTYPGLTQPVCRIYMPSTGSHFYSASPDECAQTARTIANSIIESEAAFFVALPSTATGACPRDLDENGLDYLVPLYRLWNPISADDHRYTTDQGLRDVLVSQGYVAEGYGPDAVAMCIP